MFTNLLRTWSEYHSRATVQTMVSGEPFTISMGNDWLYDDQPNYDKLGIWTPMYSQWARVHGVVSPAPQNHQKSGLWVKHRALTGW